LNRNYYKNSNLVKCDTIQKLTIIETNEMLNSWHYLGQLKNFTVSYGNENGCCVYGVPRSRILKTNCPYKIIELVRMVGRPNHNFAMSSLMSNSIKLLKKEFPDYEVIITYSDPKAGHNGNTYRAANWIDLGQISKDGHPLIYLDNKPQHPRTQYSRYGTSSIKILKEKFGNRLQIENKPLKNKFIFWINKKGDYLNYFFTKI
jgi:hypothetical protein